jgi:hypothetical protein
MTLTNGELAGVICGGVLGGLLLLVVILFLFRLFLASSLKKLGY